MIDIPLRNYWAGAARGIVAACTPLKRTCINRRDRKSQKAKKKTVAFCETLPVFPTCWRACQEHFFVSSKPSHGPWTIRACAWSLHVQVMEHARACAKGELLSCRRWKCSLVKNMRNRYFYLLPQRVKPTKLRTGRQWGDPCQQKKSCSGRPQLISVIS